MVGFQCFGIKFRVDAIKHSIFSPLRGEAIAPVAPPGCATSLSLFSEFPKKKNVISAINSVFLCLSRKFFLSPEMYRVFHFDSTPLHTTSRATQVGPVWHGLPI